VTVAGTVAGHAQPALHVHGVPSALVLMRLAVPVLLGVFERHHASGADRVLFVLFFAGPLAPVPVPERLRLGRGRRRCGRGRCRHRRGGRLYGAVVGLVVVPVVFSDHRRHGIQ